MSAAEFGEQGPSLRLPARANMTPQDNFESRVALSRPLHELPHLAIVGCIKGAMHPKPLVRTEVTSASPSLSTAAKSFRHASLPCPFGRPA